MLNINSETVRFIINKAREFQSDDSTPNDEDVVNPLGAELPEFPSAIGDNNVASQEFAATIGDLEPDQQQEMVALMWLGRGDFSVEEWDDALLQARSSWTLHTADYLLSTPLLADYLEEGLVLHGYEEE